MNNFTRNFALWLMIALLLVALFNIFQSNLATQPSRDVPYSTFINQVENGDVRNATIQANKVSGELATGEKYVTTIPPDANLSERLLESGVEFKAVDSDGGGSWLGILLSWFPMLLFIGVWIFFMRQMQGGGRGGAMGFGKSRAKLLGEKMGRVTFEDVAGVEEAKEDLEEIVDFLKDPQRFQRLGGRIPKGVLLVGPPGTGKTLLGRAIAGEANVPFFTISGSDFVEMFVGVGASRVRDMFEQAKKNAPCIIFIDELDAVGRHRGAGLGGGNDEREQTLNQLLVEMDGFETNEGVILLAATNRPDVLDPALLRPGRFDRQIVVPNPDLLGREKILKVHMRKVPLGPDVEAKTIARGTPGFSGADLANLINEAALLAARRNKKMVSMSELEDAKDKVMMGSERRSMVMSEEEKKLTAYHEAGHAILALHCPDSDPIHKATIIPRGRALGMVMRLPESDRYSQSKAKLLDDLTVATGGRIAEEMIFGAEKVTTGASADIKMVTKTARAMVTEWGMSKRLGFLLYDDDAEEVFLGRSIQQSKNISEDTARLVDEEVREIVDVVYKRGEGLLKKNSDDLETLAQALLEYETLSGDEINKVLRGEPLKRGESESSDDKKGPTSSAKSGAKAKKATTKKASGSVPKAGPKAGPKPSTG